MKFLYLAHLIQLKLANSKTTVGKVKLTKLWVRVIFLQPSFVLSLPAIFTGNTYDSYY